MVSAAKQHQTLATAHTTLYAPPMRSIALTLAAGRLSPERRLLLRQFLQFAAIGAAGFVWDTAVVYGTAPLIGLYAAGILSFFVVGCINWLANRYWTYRHLNHAAMHRQLVMFLVANAFGFVLNRGTYIALIATQPFVRHYPVLAIAAGAGAGMFVNFFLSRRLVFR
jgi:putative flippase GtrA